MGQGSKYEAQEVSDSQTLTRLTRTFSPFNTVPRRSNRYRARFSEEGSGPTKPRLWFRTNLRP